MNVSHSLRRRRWWQGAIGGAALAVTVLGPSWGWTTAGAGVPAFSSQSGVAIVAQTRKAMLQSGAVVAAGEGTVDLPGFGEVSVEESSMIGRTTGSQVLKMVALQPSTVVLPSATTLDVTGTLYVKANAPYWISSTGVSDAQAKALAGRWVEIPQGSSFHGTLAADLTMSSFVSDLFDGHSYYKEPVHTIDGVRSVDLVYTNAGVDGGPATAYIATRGQHLPVEVNLSGQVLTLRPWGHASVVSVPPHPVSISALVPGAKPGDGST